MLSVWLFFVKLVLCPHPAYQPLALVSTPLAICCNLVIVLSRTCATSRQEAAAWGQHLGPKRRSEEEEAVVPASLQRSQASAHRRLPAFIHLKSKIEGNRDKCTLCTEEITTNAALKRAKERNKLFIWYLLGGKRTEDVLCRNRRTAFLLVISWKSNILRGNYGNNLNVQLLC